MPRTNLWTELFFFS